MRRALLVIAVMLGWSGCVDDSPADREALGSTTQELQQGPPRIISTSIVGVTPSGGYYHLNFGQAYTARVIVDSGTITYSTRVESYNRPSSITMSPGFRDDNISANTGTRTYNFTITPNAGGDFQLAYQIRDRGTWNVYDINAGIALRVVITPPRIISTSINAPILDGRYQLQAGAFYTATVTVASGNVTYATRVEGNNNSSTLGQSPAYRDASIARFSGNYTFSFYFTPTTVGMFPIAFRLRDLGTWNVFDVNSGVAALVIGTAPQIVSTAIDAPFISGRYQLTVGRRYLARVRVASGTVANVASVNINELNPPPEWANVHNDESSLWRFNYGDSSKEFIFTIAPETSGISQLAFMLRDSPPGAPNDGFITPGTGNAYGWDSGVTFEATPSGSGIHGTVRSTSGTLISGAVVAISPMSSAMTTGVDGSFQFPNLPAGTYQLAIVRSGYSPSYVVNIPYSGVGFRSDVTMDIAYPDVTSVGIVYSRYVDRSQGLSLLHVVEVPPSSTHSEFVTSAFTVPGGDGVIDFPEASTIFQSNGPRVLINGGFFDAMTGHAVGYYYRQGYWTSDPMNFGPDLNPQTPVFGIFGNGFGQGFAIASKTNDYLNASATDWNATGPAPLWDDDRNGESDVSYATQNDAFLNQGSYVETGWTGDYARYWARTSVGVAQSGGMYMVVADGEGIHGVQGASLSQLGYFYRDVLNAPASMNFDGGGSTVMLLKNGSGYRQVTVHAAENPRWSNPSQGWGVLNYLLVW